MQSFMSLSAVLLSGLGGGKIFPEIQTRACERGAYGRLSMVEFEVIPHALLTTCEWFTIVTASKSTFGG